MFDAEELVEKKDDEKEDKEEQEKPAVSEKELEEIKKATEKFVSCMLTNRTFCFALIFKKYVQGILHFRKN